MTLTLTLTLTLTPTLSRMSTAMTPTTEVMIESEVPALSPAPG